MGVLDFTNRIYGNENAVLMLAVSYPADAAPASRWFVSQAGSQAGRGNNGMPIARAASVIRRSYVASSTGLSLAPKVLDRGHVQCVEGAKGVRETRRARE